MLTRRTLLTTGATLAAVPVTLGAARAATPPGIVVMAHAIDGAISFDPAQAYEAADVEIDANVYQKLVGPNLAELSKIGPDLASSWEVSSDGMVFTFHLGEDAYFSSGKPVTAEDAAFSLHRAVILNLTPGFIITQFGFTKDNVAELVRAAGPHTLVVKLGKPAATSFVLYCLSANVGGVVEKATALAHQEKQDLGNRWLTSHSAGSGPYQLASWAAADHIILDANPHAKVKAKTKRIFVRHVKDPSTQVLMLRRGDADIARDLSADLLKSIAGDPNIYKMVTPGTGNLYISGNEAFAPIKKSGVRQAIKWAIDYTSLQKNIVPDTYTVNQSFEPSMMLGALTDYPFHKDTAKAKALLAEAGYKDGFSATLDHFSEHPYSEIATAVQADLGEIGIKISLLPATHAQVYTKMRARQHQLIMSGWFPDYFDPNSNAQGFCANPDDSDHSRLKALAWRNHFYDPTLTAEVEQAAQELDTAKRVAIYHKMQQQFWGISPFVIMLQENETAALRKNVKGFHLGAQADFVRYDNIVKI